MQICERILEEFEYTKGVIRIRISKKNRHHNGQAKKDKRTNNDLSNVNIKLTTKHSM
jgi:hypothetical protein